LEEWFQPISEDDPAIAAWKSSEAKRTMRIQERDEDDPIEFDWVIGRSGADREFADLLVEVRYCDREVNLLFEIFRRWFLDRCDVVQMTAFVEGHQRSRARLP
jgi:hypothetical protein